MGTARSGSSDGRHGGESSASKTAFPGLFAEVIAAVVDFADPAISGTSYGQSWDPAAGEWT